MAYITCEIDNPTHPDADRSPIVEQLTGIATVSVKDLDDNLIHFQVNRELIKHANNRNYIYVELIKFHTKTKDRSFRQDAALIELPDTSREQLWVPYIDLYNPESIPIGRTQRTRQNIQRLVRAGFAIANAKSATSWYSTDPLWYEFIEALNHYQKQSKSPAPLPLVVPGECTCPLESFNKQPIRFFDGYCPIHGNPEPRRSLYVR